MLVKVFTVVLLTLAGLSGALQAAVIDLDSQPGLTHSLSGVTVAVTPHPSWQANNPVNPWDPADNSAVWISYDMTGYGDAVFQPYNGTTPVVSIFHDFVSGAGILHLNVWADDTAEVLLDGVSLIAPKFTQSTCSGQPIGCLPVDVGVLSSPVTAGNHQLEFRLFQTGSGTDTISNPMGLLYTGIVTPEPGTLLLAGGALIAAGLIRRRRVHRSE